MLLTLVALASVPQAEVVLCLGDSITQGMAGTKSYPTRLQERRRSLRVVNRGRGGETTRGALTRGVAAIRTVRAHTVVLLYGTNDPVARIPLAETVANLGTLVNAAVHQGARRVFVVTPPPSLEPKRREAMPAIADAIAAAAWPPLVRLVDMRARWAAAGWASHADAFGLHPNDAGTALLADAIAEALAAH